MTDELVFAEMPAVLDDEELPFVLGFVPDPRPALEVGGAQYRRGATSFQVAWPIGELWLLAHGRVVAPAQVGIIASAGPLLQPWWSVLRDVGEDPTRPYLSAGLARRPVEVPMVSASPVRVRVLPSTDDFSNTVAVVGTSGSMDDELTLLALHWASIAVARAALHLLVEYQSLVGQPSKAEVEVTGGSISLDSLLAAAAQVAAALAPSR